MTPGETFQRARTDEQRAQRRAAILAEAGCMLDEGARIADISLNGLARRVGLAKSNLLRYFETREAVLLALLASEYESWLDAVEADLGATARREIDGVAEVLADTIAARPVLSELIANAQLVLEQNVSAEVAAAYKRTAVAQAIRLVSAIESQIGPLPDSARLTLAGGVNVAIGGVWGLCRPSPGMAAAYERYPELAALRLDHRLALRELLATLLAGLVARASAG